MKLLFGLTLVLFFPCTDVFAQFSQQQIRLLDSIATQDVPPKAPGIATAIIDDGKVVYQKYAGYADFTDSSLINKNTRFNIASNGKQFTALAILTLVDSKKLGLQDDIRKFFPGLFPKIKETITVEDLLNHTSGIRDCYDLWSLQGYTWWKNSFSNSDVLKLTEKQEELNFSPGTKYLYSNTNYILLALIVEKITGKSFVSYTKEMFRQLNMPNTSFEDNHLKIGGPVARAYFNFDKWTTTNWIWDACGDGNIFTTLDDQVQWEKLIQGKSKTSFKKRIIERSQQIMEGSKFNNYGYGLEFGKYKGLNYVFHEGATGAWKATVIRFPDKKISLITMTNTGKSIPSMQTRQMVDVVFGLEEDAKYLETKPAKIGEPVTEDAILGTYLTENDFAFRFEKRDNRIFLKRNGRNDVELEREADNIFHQKFDPAFKQEFRLNSKNEMQVTAYYINHSPYTLTKTKPIAEGFDYKKINGNYFNRETGTTISIEHIEETNYEVKINNRENKGLLISESKMLAGSYSLEFENGILFLNGERIKKVRFLSNISSNRPTSNLLSGQ